MREGDAGSLTAVWMRAGQEPDVHKLPSGMLYRVLKDGKKSGKKSSPNLSDSCEVTYSGKLKDGTPFDSGTTSFAPNQVRLSDALRCGPRTFVQPRR